MASEFQSQSVSELVTVSVIEQMANLSDPAGAQAIGVFPQRAHRQGQNILIDSKHVFSGLQNDSPSKPFPVSSFRGP